MTDQTPATPPAVGTQNIVEVVDGLLEAVAVYKQAASDGKVDLNDLGLLLRIVPFIGPAVSGADQIIPEFKDLSVTEAEALVAHVMVKLSLDNPKAQAVASAALQFASSGFKLFKAVTA